MKTYYKNIPRIKDETMHKMVANYDELKKLPKRNWSKISYLKTDILATERTLGELFELERNKLMLVLHWNYARLIGGSFETTNHGPWFNWWMTHLRSKTTMGLLKVLNNEDPLP